jgi:hypothetical protein
MVAYHLIAPELWLIEPALIAPILGEEHITQGSLKVWLTLEGLTAIALPNCKTLVTDFSPDTGAAARHFGPYGECLAEP